MFVNLQEVAKALNIKLESIYKVLNRCGYARILNLSSEQTNEFINCLENEKTHYRTKLLIIELKRNLDNLK